MSSRTPRLLSWASVALLAATAPARAAEPPPAPPEGSPAVTAPPPAAPPALAAPAGPPVAVPPAAAPPPVPELRRAFEINALWPVIGISEMKAILPVWGGHHLRGELIFGAYLDYAHWIVRAQDGPTALIAAEIGYRQFFAYGFHAEALLATGLRHEEDAPNNGGNLTYNDFYMRLWIAAGWQYEFSRVYVNLRPRLGLLVVRYPHYDLEKKVFPAGDVNVGFRF